jgi:hypothetical protein
LPFPAGLVEECREEGTPMKISFDVDCTPEELRAFFGLPEVKPMQDALLKEVETRLRASLAALDPETMLKTWLPGGIKGFEQLQEMFFAQMGRGGKK